MASADHWACPVVQHDRGYRKGEHSKLLDCPVAAKHDPSTAPRDCYTCKKTANDSYRPPAKRARDYSPELHFDCPLMPWEHAKRVTGATGGHYLGCPTLPGHSGRPDGACYACRMRYQGHDGPRLGKYENHPHFDCHLTPDEHPLMKGFGKGHRQGCQVAEGHDDGWSNKCRACRQRPHVREGMRNHGLRRRHGITKGDYEELIAKQEGACGICHEPAPEGQYLHVDHDHKTGRIRGLLCRPCNMGLGFFRDDTLLLHNAADYLFTN